MLSLKFSIALGVNCEELTPVKKEEKSLEGSSVTLSYRYSKQADTNDYFFWYRQYPGKPPEFIIFISGMNFTKKAESLTLDTRFSTKLSEEKHRVDLQISSAAVTDSALYYCAVRPTVTANPQSLYKNTNNTILHNIHQREVIQPTGDVITTEGETVTLDCTFETIYPSPYLFWYKQEVNDFPKYMLKRFSKTEDNAPDFQKDRFDATINKTSVPLKIQNLQLFDSAVYYCALQPTVTGNTKTLYNNLWSKDNTILHNSHQRESHTVKLQVN
uniref:Ig-like domain-containing protein n=1 Tax=Sander lucioperca TaxID=283035 RepID=A0A8D0ASP9_SANLU